MISLLIILKFIFSKIYPFIFLWIFYILVKYIFNSFFSHGLFFYNTLEKSKSGRGKISFIIDTCQVDYKNLGILKEVDISKVPNWNIAVFEWYDESKKSIMVRICNVNKVNSNERWNDSIIIPIEIKKIVFRKIFYTMILNILVHKISTDINKKEIIELGENDIIQNLIKEKIIEFEMISWYIKNR